MVTCSFFSVFCYPENSSLEQCDFVGRGQLKSMVAQMQCKIESIENPVDDFLTKWIDTFEVMRVLNISRHTIDNYIKAVKLKPVRINKRNHFAVAEVKGLMYVPTHPKSEPYVKRFKS